MDPVTLTVGAIVSLILNKALEKTTEKLTEAGLEKLNQLRQTVQARFQDNAEVVAVLEGTLEDPEEAEETLGFYLKKKMKADGEFDREVRQLAAAVYQDITVEEVQARNMQQNFGGTNTQINDAQGPILKEISGGTIHISYGNPPK
ncbi:hypothetical protein [Prochlorothrix hollandica]|uniref:Uncharacterized protein n=1 Tax=Prochlorothrix hollandica PCC 9006 = CALU 1027 TaxID=317619 RepID=A0A0M2Q068_PROHO|nr:hypothetical protein [Prochlorothrix hollandica]KKJ00037.1 hypothetical protein PROH_09720 [Prochlorothrix hollandica PCC 9006 = CALU 1027]